MSASVTVVMAVHNAERYLREAMASVLGQTFREFEFLIVDDGSTDATPEIVAGYGDSRIRLLRNARNLGLTPTLNVGLGHASGDLIARMDADDVCAPERFARQVAFLESNPDHLFVGTGFRYIDENGVTSGASMKEMADFQLRWLGLLYPPILHPTAMYRRLLPDGAPVRYDEAYETTQDYALWSSLLRAGKGALLAPPLLLYRRHPGAISSKKRHVQLRIQRELAKANIAHFVSPELAGSQDVEALIDVLLLPDEVDGARVRSGIRGLIALMRGYAEANGLSRAHRNWLRRYAAGQLAEAVYRCRGRLGPSGLIGAALEGKEYAVPFVGRLVEYLVEQGRIQRMLASN